VHEYGGGAWWVRGGVLWFVDWVSQRLHVLEPGDEPLALTPEPEVPRGARYADGDVSPDGLQLLCVQELHPPGGGEATNRVVRLDARQPSDPVVVAEGADFVADPRWSPDGSATCWLEWDHPDMPWDAVRLVVEHDGRRTVVAGDGARESVVQPTWAADGSLWFSTDRTGFWSIHRWSRDDGVEPVVDLGKDIGFPQWVFGQRCFALLDDGRVAFVYNEGGTHHLAVREQDGSVGDVGVALSGPAGRHGIPAEVTGLRDELTWIEGIRPAGSAIAVIAASPTAEPHVVRIDLPSGGKAKLEVAVPPRDLGLDQSWFSTPEVVDFATGGGATAHALYYPPTSPEVRGPDDERPPLLVMIHGGPTSAARPVLSLAKQYWTSRGFAVVDVNYRGSTGYGRAYRDLLRGQWGVADVEDCVAVAEHLAARGEVDGARLCIRGGSAGGYTTLAALAFHDTFAAGASHFGVADLGALAADTHKFESRYLDGLVGPWPEARAVYEERSPINHTDRFDRPLVVFQGLEDEVVPPSQSEMIVEAVRSKGVPVAYVAFEGEQHGFRRAASIRASLDGELSFYAQVLGFDLPSEEGIETLPVENLP